MNSILIIDDEIEICKSIKMILEYENYSVDYSTDPKRALEMIKSNKYDSILLDIQMPGMNGFEVLDWLRKYNYSTPVVIISAYGNLENAVKATKLGAFDFIEKPIDRDKLIISVRNAVKHYNLIVENRELKENLEIEQEIIGESTAIKNLLKSLPRIAQSDARVLITGENGTGKELVARAIHKLSKRADKKLIEVNCAAIPNELIESELFGHVKGAFTGAQSSRTGKFQLADGGTLFLDEIGDMSLQAQAKVLRAIELGEIQKVGGTESIKVDVRIIAATNKNLAEEIEKGNFREDLFHRINVVPLQIPPLRNRKDDIPILANYFMEKLCRKNNVRLKTFTREALDFLKNQTWKGNIRELKNLIERIVILIDETIITPDLMRPLITPLNIKEDVFSLNNSFQKFKERSEKLFIQKQLEANNWNISKTAEAMGIQRSHLYSKIKKYKIEKEAK